MEKEAPRLVLRGLGKDYYVNRKPFAALKSVSLALPQTGFVSILGPSGCGKTTLLNVVGGLDRASRGELLVDGRSTSSYKDRDWDAYRNKRLGFVFQNYNLLDYQSALLNVELPLLLSGMPASERKKAALEALREVGLEEIAHKKPNELSGGQMQRVAIARALAGKPEIVLADEPTGALDSRSSEIVADLLKKISERCLVVLVTHNEALAERYSDRIIKMEDGEIVSDSDPLPVEDDVSMASKEGRTSMGLWAAMKNSFRNVAAKWGRTLVVSLSSSIGIVGVGLVLALSTGFSSYTNSVESALASSIPISISKKTLAYQSTGGGSKSGEEYPDDEELYVIRNSGYSYVASTNNLSNEYVSYVRALTQDPELIARNLASDVVVQRENMNFNIITSSTLDPNDPDAKFFVLDQGAGASVGSLTSMVTSAASLPTSVFHPLYGLGTSEDPSSQYDLIYGSYPQKPTDLVLIVDRYNQVDYSTLKALGIVDDSAEGGDAISFADLLEKKTYKAYLRQDFYGSEPEFTYTDQVYDNVKVTYDPLAEKFEVTSSGIVTKEMKAYVAPGNTSASYKEFYFDDSHNPIELRIVGVVRPSQSSVITTMPSSVGYLPSLEDLFLEEDNDSIADMRSMQGSNWYVPARNYDKVDGLEALQSFFDSLGSLSSGLTSATLSSLVDQLADLLAYRSFFTYESYISGSSIQNPDLLTPYGMLAYSRRVGADYEEDDVAALVDPILSGDMSNVPALFSAFLASGFFAPTPDAIDAMDIIAYSEAYSLVTSILVFPSSLTTKAELRSYLEAYNIGRPASEQVTFLDAMGDFTDGLASLVTIISVVLVIFASISLVVSSLMMAVITYVSVLERTREIGILRACGARKRDVSTLFETECFLVGGIAGLFGVLFAYLLSIPLNVIVRTLFSSVIALPDMAVLSPWIALALVASAIVLALAAGFVPSRLAAKKDPAKAIRSEQ